MLTLYWKNATTSDAADPDFITESDLDVVRPQVIEAHASFLSQIADEKAVAERMLGYVNLPGHPTYAKDAKALADKLRPRTTDLVVLGIGGSALGNIALQAALNPATYNLMSDEQRPGPRLFVLDNVDPAMVADVLDEIGPRLETTLVNVISKSGETAETAAEFMIFREVLREKLGADFGSHIVPTTDAAKGTMHAIATKEKYIGYRDGDGAKLIVPDDVGGRFSVLSHVGLFTAAMCGIDVDKLLAGAAAMKARVEAPLTEDNWQGNPAAVLAAIKYLAMSLKGKPMHVMMPYSNRLYLMADWYRQLWAESLGKLKEAEGKTICVGPTPIKALGTTDQHSQVQLYREGPNDKLTVFLEVAEHPRRAAIPDAFGDVDGLSYLRGADLARLLNAEKTATEYAMHKSRRPSVTLRFPEVTPESVGEFIYLYEFTTSLMGELLGIDAYDQPAVELGKKATFALMGRKGHEAMADEIEKFAEIEDAYLA